MGISSLWDSDTTHEESPYPITRYNHVGFVVGFAFSQDRERLLSTSTDQTIVLWDVESGQAIRAFRGHTDAVNSVAFTPDGKPNHLKFSRRHADLVGRSLSWSAVHFQWTQPAVTKVVLSPDGQLTYSAGQDGLVIVRPIAELPMDNVLAFIEDDRVLHDFTGEEREQYRIFPLCDANGKAPDN